MMAKYSYCSVRIQILIFRSIYLKCSCFGHVVLVSIINLNLESTVLHFALKYRHSSSLGFFSKFTWKYGYSGYLQKYTLDGYLNISRISVILDIRFGNTTFAVWKHCFYCVETPVLLCGHTTFTVWKHYFLLCGITIFTMWTH